MQEIIVGIVSGAVVALVLGIILYKMLLGSMEDKLHHYMEALLKYQQTMGNSQFSRLPACPGKWNICPAAWGIWSVP